MGTFEKDVPVCLYGTGQPGGGVCDEWSKAFGIAEIVVGDGVCIEWGEWVQSGAEDLIFEFHDPPQTLAQVIGTEQFTDPDPMHTSHFIFIARADTATGGAEAFAFRGGFF